MKSRKRILYLVILLCILILVSVLMGMSQGETAAAPSDGVCRIVFDDSTIYVSDSAMALVDGNRVILGKEGEYEITGSSSDGQVVMETEDLGDVRITLEDLSLSSSLGAPFEILSGGDVQLFCTGENSLSDGDTRASQEDPRACLYSKSDLKLMGDGTLNVTGNNHHGISVRGDLKINTLSLNVQSQGNALDARDTIKIQGGNLNLTSQKDGIHAENNGDATKGKVDISGGVILIDAADEGIQTQSDLTVTGGEVSIRSAGEPMKSAGSINVDSDHVFVK